MKNGALLIAIYIMCSLFLSCEKEEDVSAILYPGVDEALWDYFKAFEEEGRARGFEVDINAEDISATISSVSGVNVLGQCATFSNGSREITIDASFWASSSLRLKEFVVFHELGHCYLGRDHREDQHNNGICKSIMRSGVGGCNDDYVAATRELYISELFDPSVVP